MKLPIDYFEANNAWYDRVYEDWGEKAARHMHVEDGFSIIAALDEKLVGLISIQWRNLPYPTSRSREAYIDIIQVVKHHRRRGIARRLVLLATKRAAASGAYQLRAWSSEDKFEAIPMWQVLGFGLAPATVMHGNMEIRGFYAVKAISDPESLPSFC